jgi:hypothetical protein
MSVPHGELVVLGTVVLLGLLGKLWLSRQSRRVLPASTEARSSCDESTTLRFGPRVPVDEDEPVPESGVRLKAGARIHKMDAHRG